MDTKKIMMAIAAVIVLAGILYVLTRPNEPTPTTGYHPTILASDFTSTVDNPYFTLSPGTRFTYEAQTEEGKERIVVTVLKETRLVMGVEARVVRDMVYLDGSLVEDTLDWYAQDKEGNVWYFGEETAEYEDGEVTSTHGAWEAGIDGALPGIVMKANPKVGDTYLQEYLSGEAEDRADVLAINETVKVPFGTFIGCIKTFDYTPLDPKSLEHKYYCKETGGTTLEVDTKSGDRTELISVETGVALPSASLTPSVPRVVEEASAPSLGGKTEDTSTGDGTSVTIGISETEAKAIALKTVPGTVTAVEIETKGGTQVYVVEVDADSGPETDVIIDMKTGVVLSTET